MFLVHNHIFIDFRHKSFYKIFSDKVFQISFVWEHPMLIWNKINEIQLTKIIEYQMKNWVSEQKSDIYINVFCSLIFQETDKICIE